MHLSNKLFKLVCIRDGVRAQEKKDEDYGLEGREGFVERVVFKKDLCEWDNLDSRSQEIQCSTQKKCTW